MNKLISAESFKKFVWKCLIHVRFSHAVKLKLQVWTWSWSLGVRALVFIPLGLRWWLGNSQTLSFWNNHYKNGHINTMSSVNFSCPVQRLSLDLQWLDSKYKWRLWGAWLLLLPESSEDRPAHSWLRPSLAASLRRTVPAPHHRQHLGEWPCTLLGQYNRVGPVGMVQVSWPWRWESGRASHTVMRWYGWGRNTYLTPSPLTPSAGKKSWFQGQETGRADLAPRLGSTIELTLMTEDGVQVIHLLESV